ncbi:hypothetical protein DFS34DRAFT_598268 [Phlyctochytrium arcticum]|nr:hypothetical protein DFS34DRAFT_598268 [Phlyctochytrium arcticum]
MEKLDQFTQVYSYPPFCPTARNEELCRLVLDNPHEYDRISQSLRLILPASSKDIHPDPHQQHLLISDSLRYRIPVYFGKICYDMFDDAVLKKICGYSAAEGDARIQREVRYVVCGQVLATSAKCLEPKTAFVAHAWGINFESRTTWDYAHFVDLKSGKIIRERYAKTQAEMCRMMVRAGEYALKASPAATYCDLLVPMIGMGAFMSALRDNDDRDWALQTLIQQLDDAAAQSLSSKKDIRIIFYGNHRVGNLACPSTPSPNFRIKVNGDIFADAGNMLVISECLCVVNAWDPVSVCGNGMARDHSIDGMMGSGLGDGAQFANSSFPHNSYLMPAVLDQAARIWT